MKEEQKKKEPNKKLITPTKNKKEINRSSNLSPKEGNKIPPLKKLDKIKLNSNKTSLTPLKPESSKEDEKETLRMYMRSKSMTDMEINDLSDFDQMNISEKMKNDLMKKYKYLENQVKTLRLKDEEITQKRKGMEKRASLVNEYKREKNKFKAELRDNKDLKKRRLDEQKLKIKSIREYEIARQQTFNEMQDKKKKLMTEINKADQSLMKSMLSQTISNRESAKKSMYLREKEHEEKIRKERLDQKQKNEAYRKMMNNKKYEKNLTDTEGLREKVKKLEEIQNTYRNKLRNELFKANDVSHPVNYLNHTFYKGDKKKDIARLSLNSGTYIHYSPMKKRREKGKDSMQNTEEKEREIVDMIAKYEANTIPEKTKPRNCKTPLNTKKLKIKSNI
ncbi:MAG: hypothetical protein MJ252_01300 [archaeon]|nr:hypothetical protein [archaeon]